MDQIYEIATKQCLERALQAQSSAHLSFILGVFFALCSAYFSYKNKKTYEMYGTSYFITLILSILMFVGSVIAYGEYTMARDYPELYVIERVYNRGSKRRHVHVPVLIHKSR